MMVSELWKSFDILVLEGVSSVLFLVVSNGFWSTVR